MRFVVLGPVAAHDGDHEIRLGGPRQQAVLALLLVRPERTVSADQLVEEIWGDAAGDARASLYTYVSNLRRLLGKERIERGPFGYRLLLRPGDTLDVVEAEAAIAAGRHRATAPAEAARLLTDGLARWTGRPYDGLEDVPTIAIEITRLDELRATAEMDRIEAVLATDDAPPVAAATEVCDARPFDERAWSLLARTLYRAGRQADALRAVQELRTRMREELGLDPSPDWTRLEEQILLHDPALARRAEPAPIRRYESSFVGREAELAQLADAVERHRLVTITGPGGAGKTRLAVELANRIGRRYPAGVAFADLAELTDGDDVVAAVATALRAPSADGDRLRGVGEALSHGLLLVIDNAEQVLGSTRALLHGVLARTGAGHVVVTSRAPLGTPGEHVVRIGGLPLGDAAGNPGEAERLLAARCSERGAAVDATSAGVHSVCEQLDGIPLALELAASRSPTSTPTEIADLLERRFALLVDAGQPRELHRSLEATVGWSYGLLMPNDRDAFATLGVFDGPFSAASAAAATDLDPARALDVLHRLTTASLVTTQPDAGGTTRFRLLETLRTYARDRLIESGRWDVAVQRHDDHYDRRAHELTDDFLGRRRVAATQAVTSELPDYQATFERLFDLDPRRALPLGWVLGNVWLFQGRLAEGERQLTRLLEATGGDRSVARADVCEITSWVLVFRNRTAEGRALADEGLAVYRESGSPERVAYGCARAGHWAFILGDAATAMALLAEAVELCERSGFVDGAAWPTALIAQARRWSGDPSPEVRTMLLDARRRFAEVGETYGQIHADMLLSGFQEFSEQERLDIATEMVELSARPGGENLMRPIALHNLAYAVRDVGDVERATGLNRASIRSSIATGAAMDLGLGLLQGASFAVRTGETKRAVTLLGAGRAHFGMELAPFQRVLLDEIVAAATAELGPAQVDELMRIGAAMSAGEAAALVLA